MSTCFLEESGQSGQAAQVWTHRVLTAAMVAAICAEASGCHTQLLCSHCAAICACDWHVNSFKMTCERRKSTIISIFQAGSCSLPFKD